MTDTRTDAPLDRLRTEPENPHGFRGFGPLLALAVLVLLSVLLAPTVAPEEYVLKPTDEVTTTTVALTGTVPPTTTPTSTTAVVP